MMPLAGRVAFITGGAGGIGLGIAQAFIERDMRVVLADIDSERVADETRRLGGDTLSLVLDVTSPGSWEAAKDAAAREFGQVDVLCNNAGVSTPFGSLLESSAEDFDRVMSINLAGVFHGVRAFAPSMAERGEGHIVNTSSVNGLIPHGPFAIYSASKFGVLGLSDALRHELAPCGVGVSTLFPGLTRSRMSLAIREENGLDEVQFAAIKANMMDPIWTGRAVADAVEANRPYIVTHPDHRAALVARHAEILDAFGDPAQPGYGATAGTVGTATKAGSKD